MDKISKEARSRNMSKITGKNTKPELIVRKKLYEMGYRYRLNVKDLPGKPDIVLRKLKKVIFVHGCFWHRHAGCKFSTIPKTNTDFWHDKFNKTEIFKVAYIFIGRPSANQNVERGGGTDIHT